MDFINPNPELCWIELDPDLAIGVVEDHFKAGIVGFRLSIYDFEKVGLIDWNEFP
jgi:hypothetical protein